MARLEGSLGLGGGSGEHHVSPARPCRGLTVLKLTLETSDPMSTAAASLMSGRRQRFWIHIVISLQSARTAIHITPGLLVLALKAHPKSGSAAPHSIELNPVIEPQRKR